MALTCFNSLQPLYPSFALIRTQLESLPAQHVRFSVAQRDGSQFIAVTYAFAFSADAAAGTCSLLFHLPHAFPAQPPAAKAYVAPPFAFTPNDPLFARDGSSRSLDDLWKTSGSSLPSLVTFLVSRFTATLPVTTALTAPATAPFSAVYPSVSSPTASTVSSCTYSAYQQQNVPVVTDEELMNEFSPEYLATIKGYRQLMRQGKLSPAEFTRIVADYKRSQDYQNDVQQWRDQRREEKRQQFIRQELERLRKLTVEREKLVKQIEEQQQKRQQLTEALNEEQERYSRLTAECNTESLLKPFYTQAAVRAIDDTIALVEEAVKEKRMTVDEALDFVRKLAGQQFNLKLQLSQTHL